MKLPILTAETMSIKGQELFDKIKDTRAIINII